MTGNGFTGSSGTLHYMAVSKRSVGGVGSGVLGFLGLSALTGVLITTALTPALAVTGLAANNGIALFENLPGYLNISALSAKSDIYATRSDGSVAHLASFFDEDRQEVGWDAISQFAKDAAVAAEDPRFYSHGGVDLQGSLRGAVITALGGKRQGGSSITQQYVKNVLINNGVNAATTPKAKEAAYEAASEPTAARKLKEMRYAISLEKKYSKNQILTGYLNIAGFGGRVYGIESAAEYYYGVPAKDLTLPEAASLLAIINEPDRFRLDKPNDKTNGAQTVNAAGVVTPYADTKGRRDYILKEMLQYKKITQQQHDDAVNTPIAPKITPPSTGCQTAAGSAYFCDYVSWVIRNQYDDLATTDVNEGTQLLQTGGLQIYTTLDLDLQNRSETAIAKNVPFSSPQLNIGSVSVSVQPGTGRILAMAQNKNYSNDPEQIAQSPDYSAINLSSDFSYGGSGGMQPGSTFKVFTLAEWLNEGHSLNETFNGSRRDFTRFKDSCNASGGASDGTWNGHYNPLNDDQTQANTALAATKYSVNSAFVSMAQQLDLCKIRQTAAAFNVRHADGTELQLPPAAVLGTEYVSPLTMATAFAGIANKGLFCTPIAIDKIMKADGSEVTPPASKCSQAVSEDVAAAMTYALQQTFNGGTASASNTGTGIPHIGKTGTTDSAVSTWMDGASTKVATVVWVGNISGSVNLRNTYFAGRQQAAVVRHQIWKDVMTLADQKYGGDKFATPSSTTLRQVLVPIPDVTGLTPDAAKKTIEDAGFVYADGGQRDSNLPLGQVAGTEPDGQAGRGSTVQVFTSNGLQIQVPTVLGFNQAQANSLLRTVGFSNIAVQKTAVSDSTKIGLVVTQSPSAGSYAKRTDLIQIAIGIAPQ